MIRPPPSFPFLSLAESHHVTDSSAGVIPASFNKLPTMIRLPDEIWHDIFLRLLCPLPKVKWTEVRDKLNRDPVRLLLILSLVSRQFHRVAQGLLFRVIVSGVRDDEHERQAKLARTLATHPDYGLNARAIAIDDVEWPTDAGLSNMLEECLASRNMPQSFRTLWDTNMHNAYVNKTPRDRNNLTSFILALTHDVKFVDLTYSCPSQPLFWLLGGSLGRRERLAYAECNEFFGNEDEQMLNDNAAETYANHLPHLRELRLRGVGYNSDIELSPPITDFRRVLIHPNLTILRAQGFHWLGFEKETRLWASFPIRLQVLDICEAIIDAKAIRHMLAICKDLRSLYITLGNVRKAGFDVDWEFDLTTIGHSLRQFGRNLVEFGLHTDGFEANRHCFGRIGSLESMPRLRHLCITKENLVGEHGLEETLVLNEALPFALESLCFYPEFYVSPEADYPDVYQETNDEVCGVLVCDDYPDLREVTILRISEEEKVKGGEFGGAVEGWDLVETMRLVTGDNPNSLMHLNSFLTRKRPYGPAVANPALTWEQT
ncbi:hypothetical protein LCI18_002491 [Fusarium solani-melongenae]|uniref:Uncharacterized protein n=1 Tax=Fusarium solani subsp. cucurbitae TaxID=2747967 RepID=A0ACD3YRI2_FUSSC|nr:hypothetical protein LCI18_002491 [Fusarium solani-melongenae]